MFHRVIRRAAVAAVFAALVAVCSSGVPGAASATPLAPLAPHPPTAAELRISHAVLVSLNAERRAAGLTALRVSAALERSARGHDLAMMRADVMAHQLPGEPVFTARIRAAGYRWRWAGENIAWNSAMTRAGALQLERVMFTEKPPRDEHRRNILDRHFRDVGVDVYLDARHHRLWLTEDFGAR